MVNVIIEEPAFTIVITGGIGAQGSKGDPGNGIASAVLNDDYTLTLNFTDGTSYTTEPIRGAQGETGATGNGISSAVLNPDYTLTLYFTDGTHYTTTSIRGAQGAKGDKGDQGIQGIPGERGERGEQGVKGDPGFSPIATVTKSGTVTTISITDENGTTTEDVLDGAPGAKGDTGAQGAQGIPGVSPTVSVTDITGGHRITITDADHPGGISFDVPNGSPGEGVPTGGTTGQILKKSSGTDYDTEWGEEAVKNVKVNGSSIVDANGSANIPLADENTFGALRTGLPSYTGMQRDPDGYLKISAANDYQAKQGTNNFSPIVPSHQHESIFYGLSKLAGADLKNETITLGTYPDAAKVAIQKMLGVYEAPWELIREDTFTNATEANYDIEVDALGQSFELTDVILLFETPVQEGEATFVGTGSIYAYVNNSNRSYYKVECGGYTQAANATSHGCAMVTRNGLGMFEMYRVAQSTSSNTGAVGMRYGTGFAIDVTTQDRVMFKLAPTPITVNRIRIAAVSGTGHYYLYGRRK